MRGVEVVDVSPRHRAQLGERLEPGRPDHGVAFGKSLDAVGGELKEQIIARRQVELDGDDRDLGLARNLFDSGTLEAVSRKQQRGGLEDSLSAGAPFAFLYAHQGKGTE